MKKYLIILSIIIIVFYCLYCNQKDNKETFTSLVGCNTDIATLTNLAKELQSPTGILIPRDLTLKYRHKFSSGDDDWLRLKSHAITADHANMAVRNLNVDGSFNLLPRGMITVWNKNVAPSGWAFCDGTQGTPDLRGRFILGQGQGPNLTNRSLGEINGYESKILTIDELPSHTHGIYELTAWWPGATSTHKPDEDAYKTMITANTGSAGGSASFDKMPPFYVLAYIMKL
jgi:microcystin-dependent protein